MSVLDSALDSKLTPDVRQHLATLIHQLVELPMAGLAAITPEELDGADVRWAAAYILLITSEDPTIHIKMDLDSPDIVLVWAHRHKTK